MTERKDVFAYCGSKRCTVNVFQYKERQMFLSPFRRLRLGLIKFKMNIFDLICNSYVKYYAINYLTPCIVTKRTCV